MWEVLWLLANCVIILGLSLYWHDNAIGIFSALTGIAYVVCNGKGKLTAYLFGVALLLRGLLVLHVFPISVNGRVKPSRAHK